MNQLPIRFCWHIRTLRTSSSFQLYTDQEYRHSSIRLSRFRPIHCWRYRADRFWAFSLRLISFLGRCNHTNPWKRRFQRRNTCVSHPWLEHRTWSWKFTWSCVGSCCREILLDGSLYFWVSRQCWARKRPSEDGKWREINRLEGHIGLEWHRPSRCNSVDYIEWVRLR